ncbi:MAG: cytochrome P450 [Pseudomonadota bacterium]
MSSQENDTPLQQDSPYSIAEVSAFDPVARVDPHPRLRELREQCPVMYDQTGKTWFLTRYEDVRRSLQDKTIARHPVLAEEGSFVASFATPDVERDDSETRLDSILFLNDPDHTRIRTPFAKVFYPRIKKMQSVIEQVVADVVAAAPDAGSFDLVQEIALPLPIIVIAKIIGVDDSRLKDFREWSEAGIHSLDPLRTPEQTQIMIEGSQNLHAYFLDLMKTRKAAPRDDLTSDLMLAQAHGADMNDEEIATNLQLLLAAGNLTTTDLIGSGVWLFLTNRDQLQKLKDDPSLAESAVEEVLRMESPAAVTARVIMDERQMDGCPMSANQGMLASLHGANRDPDAFENPDTFDIARKGPPHVAFGGGQHLCLGAPLARLETRHLFKALFEKYPDLHLAEGDDAVEWRSLPLFRGTEKLMVATGSPE